MEAKIILTIFLSIMIITLWIYIFKNKRNKINLIPWKFKYVGFIFLASTILMLILTKEDYLGISFYIGILGGMIVALSKDRRENEKNFNKFRQEAIYNNLKIIFPIVLILGIINETLFNNGVFPKDITLFTPSTIFLLIIGYLIFFNSRKKFP